MPIYSPLESGCSSGSMHGDREWTTQGPPHHNGQPLPGYMAGCSLTWWTMNGSLIVTVVFYLNRCGLFSIVIHMITGLVLYFSVMPRIFYIFFICLPALLVLIPKKSLSLLNNKSYMEPHYTTNRQMPLQESDLVRIK